MRGLFLYLNDPVENKGKEEYLAGTPTAGDTIWVQAYVYNYSQDTETGPFTVRFSHAPYSRYLRDQAPDLTTIGDLAVDNLEPRQRKAVSVKWEIPKELGGKKIVIYVTLDPENEVPDEIHELYVEDQSPEPTGTCPAWLNGQKAHTAPCGIFCGSNNQGFWPWSNGMLITPASSSEEETTVPHHPGRGGAGFAATKSPVKGEKREKVLRGCPQTNR